MTGALSLARAGAGKEYWIGLYKYGPDWSWANSRCAETSFTNWATGQPDAAFGHEECVLVSSAGRWEDYGCHLAESRCLCELGSVAPQTYYTGMQAHADVLDAATWEQRRWLGAVLGAVLGLPVLLDENIACFGSLVAESALARAKLLEAVGRLTGWALFFVGLAPLVLHYSLGSWDAAQLGNWPTYASLHAWGGMFMVEFMQPNERIITLVFICSYLMVCFTAMANVGALLLRHGSLALSSYEQSYLFTWCGFGALTFYSSSSLIVALVRCSAGHVLNRQAYYLGRLVSGACGAFLLLVFLLPISISDPQFALQHPYGFGTLVTSLSWLAFGILWKPGLLRGLLYRDLTGKGGTTSFV